MSVRSIFPHSVLSHHTLPREGNENLITGDFLTTFFVFEVCFEEAMHIYDWRYNILNKYFSLCYIPVLCVLSPAIAKGVVSIWMTESAQTGPAQKWYDSFWFFPGQNPDKWSICFYLIASSGTVVLMDSLLQKRVAGQVFYLNLFSSCFSCWGFEF